MRVVAAVCLLLVCSVLAPSAVLAGASEHHGQFAATVPEPSQKGTVDTVGSSVQSANRSNTSSTSNSSLGLQVSSFVQSTSAETSGVVENEMWEADVNRSPRSTTVSQRVDHLDRRVSTLREQRQNLVQSYENGSISTLRYQSQLAHLNGELNALSAAAGSTERAATRLNTDAPGLSKVQAEIERSKETTPPTRRTAENPGQGNGPPTDQESSGQGNGQQAGQANPSQGSGPPTDQEKSSNGNGQQAGQESSGQGNGQPASQGNPGEGNGPPTDEAGESAADNATTTDDSPGNAGGNSANTNEGSADNQGKSDSANPGNSGESNSGNDDEESPGNSDERNPGNNANTDSGNGSESNSGNGGADSPGNSGADNPGNDGNNPDRSSVLVHL
jgi:hypothetical protein